MLYIVITFLCLSIVMYLLFGGADFGAGIVELLTRSDDRRKTRPLTYHAIGPVWEANHMWLIIMIVILFVGFPFIYATLSTYLHIPLLLMLLGIIGRGTAFIFRHYDAVKDSMQRVYNFIFMYSSFITPFFVGIIAGAMFAGNINPDANHFYDAYLGSWLHAFPISVGFFTVAICGFLAAVYLSGETTDHAIRKIFIHKAKLLNIATVFAGAMVFIAAEVDDLRLIHIIITEPVTLIVLILATLSLLLLWYLLNTDRPIPGRIIAGFQVTAIIFAFGYHYFPDFVVIKQGENLSLYNTAASELTINSLAWALILGSIFILPALYYLIYSFQKTEPEPR